MRVLAFLFLSLVLGSTAAAQSISSAEEGAPYYQTRFLPEVYGLHSQNWAVVQDPRGVVYVANTNGLLEYDGRVWRSIPLSNRTAQEAKIVRSLAVDARGRVYVGGVGDMGYLAPDSLGSLEYVSLVPHLPDGAREFGDVWTAFTSGSVVYFQSYRQIMRWDGRQMTIWKASTRYLNAFLADDVYYVREEGRGLLRLDGEQLVARGAIARIADASIYTVLSHPYGLLVGTRDEGFLLITSSGVVPWPTELDAYLKEHRPYHVIPLDRAWPGKHLYAIATFGGGVGILDDEGRLVHVYREDAGLDADDAVLYLHEDRQGGLWLALDQGIRRIDVLSPLTRFDLGQQLEGSVYDVERYREALYVATSTGLFRLSPGQVAPRDAVPIPPHFERVTGVHSQCWSLLSVGDQLLVAANQGLYVVTGTHAEQILEGLALSMLRSVRDPSRVYVGMEGQLVVLRQHNGAWTVERRVALGDEQIQGMQEDALGNLWMTPMSGGVIQARLDSNGFQLVQRYGQEAGIGNDRGAVIDWGGAVHLVTQSGVYRIIPGQRNVARFVPVPINPVLLTGEYYLHPDESAHVWVFKDRRIHRLAERDNGDWIEDTPAVLELRDARVETVFEEPDGVIWFGTDKGLLRFDPARTKEYEVPFLALVRQVEGRDHDQVYGGFGAEDERAWVTLPHAENALRFIYAAPTYNDPQGIEYQYLLEGFDNTWSSWSSDVQTEYTNLPESGQYRFRVRARNTQGVVSEEDALAFRVLPPWYRTWWSYAGYILAFGAILWGFSTWRLRAHRREMEEERMVSQRLERMNARLAETNERLRQADKLKDDLLANTSHELRTPLTAILGFSSVLKEESDEDQAELADAIHRSGQRLLDTVNGLLDMAKLQANMLELHPTKLDVSEAARDVLSMLRPLAEDKGLYLQLMPERSQVESVTDRYGLERILINLVSNAIKFTDEGGITVLIDSNEQEVIVTVRDTGIGMEAEFLPNLFEAFTQASTGYGRSYEGSGLGLAIVRRVVDLFGGQISVRSTVGAGTTFVVILPHMKPAGGGPGLRYTRSHVSEPVLEGTRVLALETDPTACIVLTETLGSVCTLVITDTLAAALREARAMPFDALLIAVGESEETDERNAVEALRALPGYGRTPMAALTSGEEGGEQQWRRLGFEHHISRPVDPEALLQLVVALLTNVDVAMA